MTRLLDCHLSFLSRRSFLNKVARGCTKCCLWFSNLHSSFLCEKSSKCNWPLCTLATSLLRHQSQRQQIAVLQKNMQCITLIYNTYSVSRLLSSPGSVVSNQPMSCFRTELKKAKRIFFTCRAAASDHNAICP